MLLWLEQTKMKAKVLDWNEDEAKVIGTKMKPRFWMLLWLNETNVLDAVVIGTKMKPI